MLTGKGFTLPRAFICATAFIFKVPKIHEQWYNYSTLGWLICAQSRIGIVNLDLHDKQSTSPYLSTRTYIGGCKKSEKGAKYP